MDTSIGTTARITCNSEIEKNTVTPKEVWEPSGNGAAVRDSVGDEKVHLIVVPVDAPVIVKKHGTLHITYVGERGSREETCMVTESGILWTGYGTVTSGDEEPKKEAVEKKTGAESRLMSNS